MELNKKQQQFRRSVINPWLFKFYLLQKIPIAMLSGLQVRELNAEKSVVSVPFKWLSQNPFRSIYFASQAMAAEMSTGVLGLMAIQGDVKISMLVTHLEAVYMKKATSRIYFTCENGNEIFAAVQKTIATGEGVEVKCTSTGRMKDGTEVSNFYITWSFKKKSGQ